VGRVERGQISVAVAAKLVLLIECHVPDAGE
jgi:hypothetical protein